MLHSAGLRSLFGVRTSLSALAGATAASFGGPNAASGGVAYCRAPFAGVCTKMQLLNQKEQGSALPAKFGCYEYNSGSGALCDGMSAEAVLPGSADQLRAPQGCPPPIRLSGIRLAKMGPSKGRGPLIAKYAPVGFKKGFGAVGLGKHTKKGFFLINSMLVPKFHVSKGDGFELKPYVSPETYKIASQKFWEEDKDIR